MEKVPLTWNFLAKINIASEIIQVLLRTTSEHLSLACSHFLIGKKWQLKPKNYGGEMFHFPLRVKTMDLGGPEGLLGAHYRPGGTPKQPLLKSMSPQMSKKVEKCEFCSVNYSL